MGKPLLTDEIIEKANRGEIIYDDQEFSDPEETKIIVSGADPDRMGSLINESVIYTMSSKVQALPRYRFWNSDMSEKNIVDTFHNLYEYNEVIPRTGSEANLAEAEELRSRMDFLVGLNSTRLLTLKSGTKIRSGRVNTAAMKILYVREVEIRDFVSKT